MVKVFLYSRSIVSNVLTLILSLCLCLALFEAAVRFKPVLLPISYRITLPVQGIELFNGKALEGVPIEGIPIPFITSSLYTGTKVFANKPPSDLQALGMVKPSQNPDFKNYPNIMIKTDELGFPNDKIPDNADVLFLGDSFCVAAAVENPDGLQRTLADASGLSIYNLGVSATGAVHQEWILRNIGLTRFNPKAVLWFIFPANDFADAGAVFEHKKRGIKTYKDLYKDFPYPALYSIGAVRELLKDKTKREALPPLLLNKTTPMWFYPEYLKELAKTKEELQKNAGVQTTLDSITRVWDELKKRGIKLIIVYVPSKEQVYLPHVEENAEKVYAAANFINSDELTQTADAFYDKAVKNRQNAEEIISAFVKTAGISYISMTPYLEQLAAQGINAYLSADTHWTPIGQNSALTAMLNELMEKGKE
ncbi:hypothetical protein MCHI_003253 [Candidatus Magnetoovum chiemensis]|nr:hypothetical protein MCHI_003253 [Candidatus Magnetoovum chiemensis]